MRRFATLALLCSALLFAAPRDSDDSDSGRRSRFPRVRLGGVMVNAGYSRWSGPWGPGWWGPAYGFNPWIGYPFGSYFYPGFWGGYGWASDKGEVKLIASDKEAEVYIEGAYAGTAGRLKSMWLDPGVYNIEVRRANSVDQPYRKKIYVLTGKALRLEAR